MMRKPKLPVELEKQLKNVKDVGLRKYYRKQLKVCISLIERYEKFIKEANEPFVFKNPFGNIPQIAVTPLMEKSLLLAKDQQEDLYRRKIEQIPHHTENRDRVKAQFLNLKSNVEELENNA